MSMAYLLAVAPLPALAGPPIAFDGWSASNGAIAAGCPAGFQCEVIGASNGFMQRNITSAATGTSYVQTIVAGPNANGSPIAGLPFSDEGFIRGGGSASTGSEIPDPSPPSIAVSGIADKQVIRLQNSTANATQSFDYRALIQTGWAAESGVPNVDIRQSISETSNTNKQFEATTLIQSNNDVNGNQTGLRLDYETYFVQPQGSDQRGGIEDAENQGNNQEANMVVLRQRSGDMLTSSGSASLANGRSISWQAGDSVATTWFGQRMSLGGDCKRENRPRMRCQMQHGFQSLDNASDNSQQVSEMRPSTNGPFTWWSNPFGPQPVMPATRFDNSSGD